MRFWDQLLRISITVKYRDSPTSRSLRQVNVCGVRRDKIGPSDGIVSFATQPLWGPLPSEALRLRSSQRATRGVPAGPELGAPLRFAARVLVQLKRTEIQERSGAQSRRWPPPPKGPPRQTRLHVQVSRQVPPPVASGRCSTHLRPSNGRWHREERLRSGCG